MPPKAAEAQIEAAVYRACLLSLTRPGAGAGKAIERVRALLVAEAQAVADTRRAAGVRDDVVALHLEGDLARAKGWQPHQAAVFRSLEKYYTAHKSIRFCYDKSNF